MTREERKKAIEVLDDMKVKIDIPKAAKTQNDRNWALDVAIQALSQEPKILNVIDFAIYASNGDTNYFVGFRNGLRYAESLIDGEEPQFESCAEQAPCDDAVSRILTRMWNCRGKHTTSIDKVAMEQIIRDELPPVTSKSIECEDAISREWLKTAIHNFYYGLKHTPTEEDIQAYIDVAPSVTQKSKYWIDKDSKLYKMPDDIPIMTIQYPTITHGDTISRTEVMKVISDFVALEKYIDEHNHITFEPLEKMINALPSVTHKSGKWILLDECANSGYYCSRCQKKLVKEGWSDTVKKIKFCPNCGAKMVEPQESEE